MSVNLDFDNSFHIHKALVEFLLFFFCGWEGKGDDRDSTFLLVRDFLEFDPFMKGQLFDVEQHLSGCLGFEVIVVEQPFTRAPL